MQLVSLILIHWIVIYPLDSAIQRLNNRGQKFLKLEERTPVIFGGCIFHILFNSEVLILLFKKIFLKISVKKKMSPSDLLMKIRLVHVPESSIRPIRVAISLDKTKKPNKLSRRPRFPLNIDPIIVFRAAGSEQHLSHFKSKLDRFSNRTGTSVDDGKARGKD